MRKIVNFLTYATMTVICIVWGIAESNPALKVVYFVAAAGWGVMAVQEIAA